MFEETQGLDHPDVAMALNNLANLHILQGRLEEAEPLYQRALVIHEKALGMDSPEVAMSLSGLAGLYQEQGRHGEAEPLYQRALLGLRRRSGPIIQRSRSWSTTWRALTRLRAVLEKPSRSISASLAILEEAHGADHPNIAAALNNLAGLYERRGMLLKAEPLYKRALAIVEKTLGADHPNLGDSAG